MVLTDALHLKILSPYSYIIFVISGNVFVYVQVIKWLYDQTFVVVLNIFSCLPLNCQCHYNDLYCGHDARSASCKLVKLIELKLNFLQD